MTALDAALTPYQPVGLPRELAQGWEGGSQSQDALLSPAVAKLSPRQLGPECCPHLLMARHPHSHRGLYPTYTHYRGLMSKERNLCALPWRSPETPTCRKPPPGLWVWSPPQWPAHLCRALCPLLSTDGLQSRVRWASLPRTLCPSWPSGSALSLCPDSSKLPWESQRLHGQ